MARSRGSGDRFSWEDLGLSALATVDGPIEWLTFDYIDTVVAQLENAGGTVDIAYEGTTIPSRFFFPAYPPLNALVDAAGATGAYDRNPIMTHDPNKAKQLIEANGYTMGDDGFYQKDGQPALAQKEFDAFEAFKANAAIRTTRSLRSATEFKPRPMRTTCT